MKKALTTFLLLASVTTASHATSDEERAALANFITELDALNEIIDDSKRAADLSSEFTFDYPALQADLSLIRQGVLDYLQKARREPRELPPLSGEYRE